MTNKPDTLPEGRAGAGRLEALAERVEALSGPDDATDLEIATWCYENGGVAGVNYEPALWVERNGGEFTSSIDAAMQLVPERTTTELVMQDRHSLRWKWTLRDFRAVRHGARANNAALALCAAALRAQSLLNQEKPK